MKKWTASKKEKIVKGIIKILKGFQAQDGIVIYYSGKRLEIGEGKYTVITEGYKGSDYVECSNDDTVTVVYESSYLYDIINQTYGSSSYDQFDEEMAKLLEPYDTYYERCTSWAFTLAF